MKFNSEYYVKNAIEDSFYYINEYPAYKNPYDIFWNSVLKKSVFPLKNRCVYICVCVYRYRYMCVYVCVCVYPHPVLQTT